MIEFGRRELGLFQKAEKRVALIGADQGKGAGRVSQQVLCRALRVGQHRPGAEQKDEARLGKGGAGDGRRAQGRTRATASATRGLIQIVRRCGNWYA